MIESMQQAGEVIRAAPLMTVWAVLLGALLGIFFGAMPGLGSITGMAIILPFTYQMDPFFALMLYAGMYSSVPLGGSIPAILLNTPGSPASIATVFDGYPLARKGQAGFALGISAISAFIGSLLGAVVLLAFIPVARPIVMAFGAPQYFWLIILGLLAITFAAKGNLLKGVVAGGLGILLAIIGYSTVFGVPRYTVGSEYLWGGVNLIPFFIGIFALSEIMSYTARGGTVAPIEAAKLRYVDWLQQAMTGIRYVLSRPTQCLRGSVVGVIIGVIPGLGGTVANFMSYLVAMQRSKHPETFGTGNPEGVIACETGNNAKEGGALVTTVGFGIPGSADHCILLGAFIIHGLSPGPAFIMKNLYMIFALLIGVVFGQVITSIVGFFVAGWVARLSTINIRYLSPFIVMLCFLGTYIIRGNIWDVGMCLGMGLLGYVMKRFGFPVITMVIGFVLGGLAELSFHQALMSAWGSYTVFFGDPLSIALVVLISMILIVPVIQARRTRRL